MSLMMCPSSIWIRRCIRAAMAWSWVITMIVVPWALSSSSRSSRAEPVAESRFPVGSSASTTAGRPTIARATATRCRSPPDSWVGRAPARCPSPTRSSAAAASQRRSARPAPAYSIPSATLSRIFWCSARKNCWNTNPIRDARSADNSRSFIRAMSTPVTRTIPLVGMSRVPIRCSSVLLPDPDGPVTAASSPALTATLTSSSARTGGEEGYTFDTFCSSSTGSGAVVAVMVMSPAPPRAVRASAPR